MLYLGGVLQIVIIIYIQNMSHILYIVNVRTIDIEWIRLKSWNVDDDDNDPSKSS